MWSPVPDFSTEPRCAGGRLREAEPHRLARRPLALRRLRAPLLLRRRLRAPVRPLALRRLCVPRLLLRRRRRLRDEAGAAARTRDEAGVAVQRRIPEAILTVVRYSSFSDAVRLREGLFELRLARFPRCVLIVSASNLVVHLGDGLFDIRLAETLRGQLGLFSVMHNCFFHIRLAGALRWHRGFFSVMHHVSSCTGALHLVVHLGDGLFDSRLARALRGQLGFFSVSYNGLFNLFNLRPARAPR
mmetsp:Transcript_106127/g.342663  ORF Transcript_106127/g.342663 Transcript_106127/m.342663 type:complete len:244 (-) Transcript_106127:1713-2444(-)